MCTNSLFSFQQNRNYHPGVVKCFLHSERDVVPASATELRLPFITDHGKVDVNGSDGFLYILNEG